MNEDNRPIDFAALQLLDAEAKALIEAGQWTREHFESLWARALEASGEDESLLDFLSLPAEPEWLAAEDNEKRVGHGFRRISGLVADVICRLKGGWAPRVVLSRAKGVVWNDRPMMSARADVEWGEDGVRLHATSDGDDVSWLLHHEILDPEPGSIVRSSFRTEHAGNWSLEVTNASVESLVRKHGKKEGTFEAHGSGWNARCASLAPSVWVAPIHRPLKLRLTNLYFSQYFSVNNAYGGGERGWHCRLLGSYAYNFVTIKESKQETQYMIVEPLGAENLEVELLYRDLVALRFLLGGSVSISEFYGLHDLDIVACIGLSSSEPSRLSENRIPAIADGPGSHWSWLGPFFTKLSSASRQDDWATMVALLDAYSNSRHGTIDNNVLMLHAAVTSFAQWKLRDAGERPSLVRTSDAWNSWAAAHLEELAKVAGPASAKELLANIKSAAELSPRQSLERALAKLKIDVPKDLLDEVYFYDEKLRFMGVLNENLHRSDAELEREMRVQNVLRTILVSLVAASIDYRGAIRGVAPDEGTPSWWSISDEQAIGFRHYVAVVPPRLIELPEVAANEVLVLVEQRHQIAIVEALLQAAALPVSRVRVMAGDGESGLRLLAQAIPKDSLHIVVLAGSTQRSIPSAIQEIKKSFDLDHEVTVLCAVPDVDAWLLADDNLLRQRVADDPELLTRVNAMPLPAEIVDPFQIAHQIFGPADTWGALAKADIYRASVRSPSLRHFLSHVGGLLGQPMELPVESAGRTISRDAIAGLIREMMPADALAWRTSDGHEYSAESIGREVENGTDVGHQYARDMLRLAIDFLQRQARRRRSV